jgi:hypothetical protein
MKKVLCDCSSKYSTPGDSFRCMHTATHMATKWGHRVDEEYRVCKYHASQAESEGAELEELA